MKNCYVDAIRIRDGISIDKNTCSECMMCVSVCLTGTFQIRAMDFNSIMARGIEKKGFGKLLL